MEVFDSALQHEKAEQEAFVSAACNGDEPLSRVVKSMLLAHHDAAGFGSGPLRSSGCEFELGSSIGPYRIESLLGAGGMGEVYRARDTKLNRDVALKVLPESFALDPERLARFKREAQVLASLNHQNIAAIYGLEESEGQQALVLELVEGITLSERIARGPIPFDEALSIAKQIADALEAAHEQTIIHRDLKPANVKVRPDGAVKVLDFGLAKASNSQAGSGYLTHVPTHSGEATRSGIIIGTAAYMSPEQARAQAMDQRTDVWAFGCLLFEMLCGQPAFARSTVADTLAAVVGHEPDWRSLPPLLPSALPRLLKKCLAKDVRRRLRNIGDAALELDDALGSATREAPLSKSKITGWPAIAAVAILGLSVAALWTRPRPASSPTPEILQPVRVTTYPGTERSPSFSPDASQVAFVWDGDTGDNPDIYIKRLGSGLPVRLTKNPDEEDQPVWSPNGDSIAFLRGSSPVDAKVVVIPSLGGPERIVAEDAARLGSLDWSPDGRWLVYNALPEREQAGLWMQSLESGERHRLMTSAAFDRQARFSPDGRALAFVRYRGGASDLYVTALDAQMRATADPRRLTIDGLNHGSPQWLANTELVFTSGAPGAGYIERMSAFGGPSRRFMTIDAPGGIAVSPRAGRLLISMNTSELDIHRVELADDGAHPQRPVIASSRYDGYPVYSQNGERIAFASTRSGEWQIWASDKDGTNSTQLTNLKGAEARPTTWRPASGRQIGLVHNGDGTMRAYMVDAGGGIPQRVPELANVTSPVYSFWWSPNGRWVVYSTPEGVWKIPTAGGAPEKLGLQHFVISFDGTNVVGFQSESEHLRIVQLDGSAVESIPIPMKLFQSLGNCFSLFPGSRGPQGLYAVLASPPWSTAGNLIFWKFPDGPVSTLDTVQVAAAYGMSLSPNGRSLLYSKFVSTGADLTLVENFK
jgi:serine/threonine protein kinase